MAVRIPIVTDFDGKGIARARKEFAQLEGAAAKTKYALGKMAMPAAAAFTALAGATGLAVKAALEDQASQEQLARTIRATTGATDRQIETNSEWIDSLSKATGFVDDDIRPSFARLVRTTKDVTKSQHLMALAADVARGTGKDLNTVTEAFSRALGGNLKSLRKLAPELGNLIKDGATTDEVFSALAGTFGGDAAAYAETAAGKFDVFAVRVGELKEAFGSKLLPFLTDKVIPALERLVTWAEDNPELFSNLAAGIAVFTGAVVLLNLALGLSTWALWIAGVAALLIYLERTYGLITKIVDGLQVIQRFTGGLGGQVRTEIEQRQVLYRQLTTGEGLPFGSGALRGQVIGGTNVTINVNGGDPRAVVDALVKWSRQNGKLPPQVQTAG